MERDLTVNDGFRIAKMFATEIAGRSECNSEAKRILSELDAVQLEKFISDVFMGIIMESRESDVRVCPYTARKEGFQLGFRS